MIIQSKCTQWNSFYIQLPPTYSGHSHCHIKVGNTKDKKLREDTIIEMAEPIQEIKWKWKNHSLKCAW
jgi:hypothetical protein